MHEPDGFDPDGASSLETLFGLPPTDDARLVVLPVPFEATVSYGRGTSRACQAVLEASWQVDLFDLEHGDPWKAGITMAPLDSQILAWNGEACALARPVIAAGGPEGDPALQAACDRVDAIGEALRDRVAQRTAEIFDRGCMPAILGGDHSVPLGAIVEAARRNPGMGILHVDAHADLRAGYEGFRYSHASIMHNVLEQTNVKRLIQVGIRDVGRAEWKRCQEDRRVIAWPDPVIARCLAGGTPWQSLAAEIVDALPETVWISFDIDGLDPALCPGTGTPVPGGLSWRDATTLLTVLAESGRRVVGFDLCEVGASTWDANVGARMLYKLGGCALRTRPDLA